MDSLRSPTSPRLRPGGPRTLSRRQTSNIKALASFSLDPSSPEDTSSPICSGRDSPAQSSQAGSLSSPGTADFEHVLAPLAIARASELRDTREWRDEGVQVSPDALLSRPVSSASSAPAVKVIAKPQTLVPPPPLNFDSVPVAWRGMALETAQWTLSSAELQEIVSRAIRQTAQTSFIRLLSLKTLDEELVAEMERLDTVRGHPDSAHRKCSSCSPPQVKAMAQSKYRFNMHRRTMLLQSLLAASSGEGDCSAVASLTTQLAEVTAACDALMLEVVRAVDQRAQLQHVQEIHVSSALGMALRKLNASYAKRTGELRDAREHAATLQAELEEAWKVAEDMAQEMDDLDNFETGFSSPSEPDEDDTRIDESVRLAEVIGVTGKAVAMRATLTQLHTTRLKERETERERERERSDLENHTSRVSAARRRSSRASKASLRLPKTPKSAAPDSAVERASITSRGSRSRSKSVRRRSAATSGEAAPSSYKPPVPSLQVDTATLKKSPKDGSFLEIETRPVSPASPTGPTAVPPLPTNMDAFICEYSFPAAQRSESHIRTAAHDTTPTDKRATFDFDIPPITVSGPEDDTRSLGRVSSRRVQSMQPPPRSRSQEPAATGLHRAPSDAKRFDGWPWQASPAPTDKHARRRSMPLTALGTADTINEPPPRVFSPPPEYTAGPSHTHH